jgi:hypothetical protein
VILLMEACLMLVIVSWLLMLDVGILGVSRMNH